jgi:hypothetical protein
MGPYRQKWTTVSLTSQVVEITLAPDKVTVEGTYQFHNTGDALTMTVGYPRGVLEGELRDFQAAIDDKPLEVKQEKRGQSYLFAGPYPEWKLFEVRFGADERKTLKLKYGVEPTRIQTTPSGEVRYYSYILRTGATWKGPIERATVRVKLEGLSPDDLVLTAPGGFKQEGHTLTWVFENFKPSRDIEIAFKKRMEGDGKDGRRNDGGGELEADGRGVME